MPKTFAHLKQRLAQALQQADEAEDVLELVKQAVETYGFIPSDLFSLAELSGNEDVIESAAYIDRVGNTWTGKGRRPLWLTEALSKGASLEDFRNPRFRG
ncbi:MAG: H-NS histone family protein [Rhizobacter sp.]